MTPDPIIFGVDDSVVDIAKRMESDDIGAVIICNPEERMQGMVTDRDLAVQVIAAGRDPSTCTAGDLVDGREVVTIGADDDLQLAIRTMKDHAVRRLPVIDGHRVVGIISQADLALHVEEGMVGELVEVISGARDNTGRG
jgi:CBS domain-containing protein